MSRMKHNVLSDWGDLICDSLYSGLSAGFGIFGSDGCLLEANRAMCFYLDADPHDLKPRNQFINPELSAFLQQNDQGLLYSGLITVGNYADKSYTLHAKVFRRGEQFMVYAEVNGAELFEENMKMSVLNQEVNNLQRQLIREKKNLQTVLTELETKTLELEQSNTRLEELNVEKNKYIGMVAHDLRNPIGIAASFSEMLQEDGDQFSRENRMEFLSQINQNCSFSLKLISDFLDVSKIESGIFELNLSDQEYLGFVRDNIAQNEILARNKSQRIQIESSSVQIYARFDADKIRQVFSNLLSNAIKYSFPHSLIIIDIAHAENQIITRIIDNGQGIPEAELKKLFVPFQTTSTKPTGNEKSTGLGLAIVKKIIEAHQGKISVESVVGKGSVFHFTIPLNQGICN